MKQSKEAGRERMRQAESIARAEVEWFFTSANGKVPAPDEASPAARKAAAAIDGWLRAVVTFHAGALCLRFTPRDWPESLVKELGGWTSIVVRLECAAHPGHGRTSDLETAAVLRLEEMLAAEGGAHIELLRHGEHARQHVRSAIRAYVRVRGFGPSVLPAEGEVTR